MSGLTVVAPISASQATDAEVAAAVAAIPPGKGLLWSFFGLPLPGATTVMFPAGAGVTTVGFYVPVGWKAHIYAITMSGTGVLTATETASGRLLVENASVAGSFGTLQLTDAISADECEPTSPPYEIDATAARKRVTFDVVQSGAVGAVSVLISVYGRVFKP